MSPLVCFLKTHAKDTNHALQILRTFQFANDDASQRFLYTMDVKSLYTVIPHNSGLEALKYFLNKLLELVVTLNAFSFNNEFYHQVGGVAMGSNMGLRTFQFANDDASQRFSETELPFLDINLRIYGDRIRTSIHYKATDTHSFLH